ncbi:response regulator [Archangium lansingense]|uniref:Response regulator transcription factor n=1 Tax=Archangium lansingense TaxID=2995310 RepID=A0ABT4AII1_9BACT|nr:response regulator transcription factor [Archangium lansinium]MCY1081498.1 response regulator transcription factor [Archangium lansinium]
MTDEKQVLIVDDQPELRASFRLRLEKAYPHPTIFEAGSVAAGRALIQERSTVHLALIDLGLPDGSGVELIKQLGDTHPSSLIVVVTIYADDDHLFPALSAGAHGYLLKDTPEELWLRQLRQLEGGTPALSPPVARRILEFFRERSREPSRQQAPAPPPPAPSAVLTPRETEVLGYIGRGMRIGEVAGMLGLAESTVAGYVKDIYRKLNICSRAEAALEAARRGLV